MEGDADCEGGWVIRLMGEERDGVRLQFEEGEPSYVVHFEPEGDSGGLLGFTHELERSCVYVARETAEVERRRILGCKSVTVEGSQKRRATGLVLQVCCVDGEPGAVGEA